MYTSGSSYVTLAPQSSASLTFRQQTMQQKWGQPLTELTEAGLGRFTPSLYRKTLVGAGQAAVFRFETQLNQVQVMATDPSGIRGECSQISKGRTNPAQELHGQAALYKNQYRDASTDRHTLQPSQDTSAFATCP